MCNKVEHQLKLNRRKFIKMLAAATSASLGQSLFLPSNNFLALGAVGNGKRLVFVFLGGGCSHNAFPLDHGVYRDLMGPLFPANPLPIGAGDQFMHPAFVNMHARYQAGQVLVVNKVSKPTCTRSHETETEDYLAGLMNRSTSTSRDEGIGARIACLDPSNPLAAVSLSGTGTWNNGTCNPPIDLDNLANLGERPFRWSDRTHGYFRQIRDGVMATSQAGSNPKLNFVRSAVNGVESTLAAMEGYQDVNPGVAFPNTGLGRSLADIARVIIGQRGSPLVTSTFLASLGGFDTHSGEAAALTNRLQELDGALGAFMNCLDANGLSNDVAVITVSEFGRTSYNGSGTDHGETTTMMVVGGNVNGGRYTSPPATPAEWQGRQYLRAYDNDFRSVMGQFVGGGLGINRTTVFPEPIAFGDNNLSMFRS